jgi:hypothetical protein
MSKFTEVHQDAVACNDIGAASSASLKTRRRFLASMLGGAGALALSACGGGGEAGAAAGAASNRASSGATARASFTPSPAGTTIPAATQITDNAGGIWTVMNEVVYLNGSPCGYTSGVMLLLWYNGYIFQRNTTYDWYVWLGGNWLAWAGDPRRQGSIFYGVNGHINQGGAYAVASMAQQLLYLKQLGCTLYRHDVWDANGAATLATLAKQASPSAINILPCLTGSTWGLANESDAYNCGYSMGSGVATQLKGLVKYYECGNELETGMVSGDGTVASDYNNAQFALARGLIRGMFDGIRAVDSSAQLLPAPCGWIHFGFFDMLWNGTAPDGSSGHPLVRWDVTPWHWYSDMGDICKATGGGGTYNVLQVLQQKFGKPIWLTEYGVRPTYGPDTQAASYLVGNTMLSEYASAASTYGVQATIMYELFDDAVYGSDGNYGLIQSDTVTLKPQFASLQSFIAANPR